MSVTIKEDLLKDSSMSGTWTDKMKYRSFLVSGIPTGTPSQMEYLALTATDSTSGFTIPQLLSTLTLGSLSYVVDSVTARPCGSNQFYVLVRYRLQTLASTFALDFQGGIRQITKFVDALGNPTQVATPASGVSTPRLFGIPTAYPINQTVITFLESTNPTSINANFGGCINSASWLGAAAGTVRFDGVTGSTENLIIYKNRYSFSYDPTGWNELEVVPGVDGYPPAGVSPSTTGGTTAGGAQGTGWAWFQMRPWVDFNSVLSNVTTVVGGQGSTVF
jgi:hypothetical protein